MHRASAGNIVGVHRPAKMPGMSEPVTIGIVGGGRVGVSFARFIQSRADASLLGIVTTTAARREELSRQFAVEAYASVQEMMRGRKKPQIVAVVNANEDHAPATIAALDGFAAAPFPLRFDRIENRKAVTLRTRDPLTGARAFQKALVNHLLARKAPIMDGTTPEPHITINYRGDRLNAQKMPPIGWTVDEIILTESIVGKTTHVEHGRWRLGGGEG